MNRAVTKSPGWLPRTGAVASAVNVAEAIARLVQLGATSRVAGNAVVALLQHVQLRFGERAVLAAELREPTMHRGLCAGRSCVPRDGDRLRGCRGAYDRAWEDLDVGARIRVIR